MKCAKARTMLCEYMDGLLPQGPSLEIGAHLKECSECARLLGQMQQTVHLLHAAPSQPAPSGFAESVRLRLNTETAPTVLGILSQLRLPAVRPALAAALTVFVALAIGFWTFMPGRNVEDPDAAYLQAVIADHGSYAAQQPLTDGSVELMKNGIDSLGYH